MNGADLLISSASASGIDVCFANPGTTELSIIEALDKSGAIRPVLGLFEGVCTGAADGFGRMLGRPAMTLMHLGPGFANGIANLHNARRAHSPVLNVIGDHATWHVQHDPPLASDISSLARPVSDWFAYSSSVDECRTKLLEGFEVCMTPPGKISTLVVPTDVQKAESKISMSGTLPSLKFDRGYDEDKLEKVAKLLSDQGDSVILLLGGSALTEHGQNAAGQIAAKFNVKVYVETFPARWDRGPHINVPERFPYFPEMGIAALKDASAVVLVGVKEPVAYFGVAGLPSELFPEGSIFELASVSEDAEGAILNLASDIGDKNKITLPNADSPMLPDFGQRLDVQSCGELIAYLLPENSIAVVEGATSTPPFYKASSSSAPHTLITNTGGAIGQGMPVATGAAIACPDRSVINIQADGSAAYTIQSLWTQAREQLNVVTILCSNRKYGILQVEFERAGIDPNAIITEKMTSLDNPPLDWASIATGFGVPSSRADTLDQLQIDFSRALNEPGPFLIEATI